MHLNPRPRRHIPVDFLDQERHVVIGSGLGGHFNGITNRLDAAFFLAFDGEQLLRLPVTGPRQQIRKPVVLLPRGEVVLIRHRGGRLQFILARQPGLERNKRLSQHGHHGLPPP